MKRTRLSFLPAVLAVFVALGVLVVVFFEVDRILRRTTLERATMELEARTRLVAIHLEEPLATGNFTLLRDFADRCRQRGLRLMVLSGPNGLVFDSHLNSPKSDYLFTESPSGAYRVKLGIALAAALSPCREAHRYFFLAAATGALAVLLVFFLVFRQWVRLKELARLERFRRDFIADFSHELKTPLTGILGAVDLLEGWRDSPERVEVAPIVGMIREESLRLNSLAQDVLSLARLERADCELKRERCDLVELARAAVARLEPMAKAAGMEITLDFPSGPCEVQVEIRLIERVVDNLIVNAIRHSGSRDVIVKVARLGRRFELSVEDHGVGIPESERERVFERFRRLDASRSKDTGGSGLGLAIARSIVASHGGKLTLASASPSGCRFSVVL